MREDASSLGQICAGMSRVGQVNCLGHGLLEVEVSPDEIVTSVVVLYEVYRKVK